jgi:hypothetical protein
MEAETYFRAVDKVKWVVDVDINVCPEADGFVRLQGRLISGEGVNVPWENLKDFYFQSTDRHWEATVEYTLLPPGSYIMQHRLVLGASGAELDRVTEPLTPQHMPVIPWCWRPQGQPSPCGWPPSTTTLPVNATLSADLGGEGETYRLEVSVTNACEHPRTMTVVLGGGSTQVTIPAYEEAFRQSFTTQSCDTVDVWAIWDGAGNTLEFGTFAYEKDLTVPVTYPCPDVDPTTPVDDPPGGTPELPDPPQEPQPPDTPNLPPSPTPPTDPPKRPPGTNGGGNPVNPAAPLDDPQTESPEFEELEEDEIKEKWNDILQGPDTMRGRLKQNLEGLLELHSSPIGRVYAVPIGTFYGKSFNLDLTPMRGIVNFVDRYFCGFSS